MRRHVADFIRANKSSIATPGAMMLVATSHIKSVPSEHLRAFGPRRRMLQHNWTQTWHSA